jgi:hypothetical protein
MTDADSIERMAQIDLPFFALRQTSLVAIAPLESFRSII